MKENLDLLVAIREKGLRQRDFARLVGSSDAIVSGVIRGRLNLNEADKARYAKALGRKATDIFPEE